MKKPRKGDKTSTSTRAHDRKPPAAKRKHADSDLAPEPTRSDRDDAISTDPEVSYKKPPKKGRWPKGKSGNPKGRIKGSKNKRTVIIEMMETKLGRKIPDPKKLTRYEGMMLKGIQQALSGCIRSMGFVLGEYRKAIEATGSSAAAATTEEDQQAYNALREKLRREIEDQARDAVGTDIRAELSSEMKKGQ